MVLTSVTHLPESSSKAKIDRLADFLGDPALLSGWLSVDAAVWEIGLFTV